MTGSSAEKQDESWQRRLLAGDRGAFAEFVDKYKEMVFLCCRTLGLRDDEIEDVASETFLAAYRGIGRFRGKSSLGTWLWRIAYNQAVNYLRQRCKSKRFLAEPGQELIGDKQKGPAATLQKEEREKIVWQSVEQLPRLWAVAVVLFYREQKSIKEIAKIIGIRQNTVKTYLFRARKKLKRTLGSVLGEGNDVVG